MKPNPLAWCAMVLPACGGRVGGNETGDATNEDSAIVDSSALDSTVVDSVAEDTRPSCGDSHCLPLDIDAEGFGDFPACPKCETGSVCVRQTAPGGYHTFCVRMPDACCGVPSCECMGKCACGPWKCGGFTAGELDCDGPISRRDAKAAIAYLDDFERAALAVRTLSIPLASYRYKIDDPVAHRRHLGFIIEDQPQESFAVAADRMHVDLYGYASMLLATVQEQQTQMDALRRRVEQLEARL